MEKEFKFINQKDIYQYKFYMIPKELFVNERYISLSPAAILLDDNKYYPLANSVNDMIDDLQKFYLTPTKKEGGFYYGCHKIFD